ncbi:hypothetical protein D9M72_607320 [compost metagenome]
MVGIDLRLLARFSDQRLGSVVQCLGAAPAEILDLEFEAAGRAEPLDRRRIEGKHQRIRDLQQLRHYGLA